MPLQMIHLSNSPNQQFTAQLHIDGQNMQLNVAINYDDMAGYWILRISDTSNNVLIDSVPMITGSYPAANLLEQQRYLAIGAWFIVNASNRKITPKPGIGYGEGGYGQSP